MSDTHRPSEPPAPVASTDPGIIEALTETLKWESAPKGRELRVKSDGLARDGAGFLAAMLIGAAVVWGLASAALFSPPDLLCGGCAPTDWFRWAQAVLAAAGIAATAVLAGYLAQFWRTGSIWRRRRDVAYTFGAIATAWAALVLVVCPKCISWILP